MTENNNSDAPGTSLIFLHIPKTAGTSMNSALTWQFFGYPSYHISPRDYHARAFKCMPEDERKRFKLLRGHMHYGLHEYLPQGARYFTIVRSPMERMISYWKYAQTEGNNNPNDDHWWLAAVRSLSLGEFIDTGRDVELDTGQVRRVSGIKANFGCCSDSMLDLAVKNIENGFVMAGLTERFEETLALLALKRRWRRPLLYRSGKIREATRDTECQIESNDLTKIRDLNVLDEKLYQFAEKRLNEMVSCNPGLVNKHIEKMRTVNHFAQPFFKILDTFRR